MVSPAVFYGSTKVVNNDAGGHLKPDPYSRAASALETHGRDAAEEVSSFEARHLQAIANLVRNEDIDCDYVLTRATDVCLYDKARDDMKTKYDKLMEEGISSIGDVFYSAQNTAEGVRDNEIDGVSDDMLTYC